MGSRKKIWKISWHWHFKTLQFPTTLGGPIIKALRTYVNNTVYIERWWEKGTLHKINSCPTVYTHVYIKRSIFHNSLKMLEKNWATFAKNFVPKNLQKSSNLVTLDTTQRLNSYCLKVSSTTALIRRRLKKNYI